MELELSSDQARLTALNAAKILEFADSVEAPAASLCLALAIALRVYCEMHPSVKDGSIDVDTAASYAIRLAQMLQAQIEKDLGQKLTE